MIIDDDFFALTFAHVVLPLVLDDDFDDDEIDDDDFDEDDDDDDDDQDDDDEEVETWQVSLARRRR